MDIESSENLLKKLYNHSPDLICAFGSSGDIIQVNDASLGILGYKPEELIGRNFLEYVHPEERLKTNIISQQVLEGLTTTCFENNWVHKNGTPVPLIWSATWSEEDTLCFCIGRKASEINQLKKDIQQRDAFFQALLEKGSDIFSVLDAEGNFIFPAYQFSDPNFWQASLKVLGYEPESLINRNAFEFIHPDDLEHVQASFEKLVTQHYSENIEYRVRAANGEWKWLETLGSNHLQNPNIKAIILSSRDITERKHYQLQLQESEESLKFLFDNNPDIIFYETTEGLVTNANQAFLALTQKEKPDVINQPLSCLLPKETIELCNKHLEEVLPGKPARFNLEVKMPEGNSLVFDTNKLPVVIDQKVTGVYTIAKNITPIVSSFKTIQEQANKLNSILNSIKDAFYTLDKDWRFDFVNNEFEGLTGVTRHQVVGKNIWEEFPNLKETIYYHRFHQAVNTGQVDYFETFDEILGKWIELKIYPSQEGLSVYFSDITRQKQLEAIDDLEKEVLEINTIPDSSLEATVAHYLKGLERIIPGMLCSVLRLENNKLYNLASPNLPSAYLKAIHGLPVGPQQGSCGTAAYFLEKVIVKNIATNPNWENFKQIALSNNLRACWSIPIISANRQVLGTFAFYYSKAKEPTPEEENLIDKAYNFLQPILEGKLFEKALKESNERFNLATAATNDAIWDWDLQTDTIFWGIGFEKLFGYNTKKLGTSSDTWIENIHPEDRDRVIKSTLNAISDPTQYHWKDEYQYFHVTQSSYVHVINKGQILRNKEGKAIRMTGAVHDITAQKKFESERETLIKELQAHNSSLQQFAHIVSHNLRAPVANILGLSDLLQHAGEDQGLKRMALENMVSSAGSLDTVIKDLNTILTTRGNLGAVKEKIQFEEIFNDVTCSLTNQLLQEKATLEVNFKEAPSIYSVKGYLHSILLNLLSNAVKYKLPDRPLNIFISTSKVDGNIVLYIKDNGLGMNLEKNKNYIFGLYKRLHKHIDGKGLGLFLVKTQLDALGGSIKVESKLNEGSAFYVCFPDTEIKGLNPKHEIL
ncbi:PAS domain-containing sensor histidine kinase [Adhaeribacter aquaticus]|uniref:PAS domain-containing sensor histidine kinase n=1 Tax=Adhaeribacter aquaticus TaxID=299567 RepID=UPI000402480D|nr:PAS domain-containing sensor histidine kinase [Adhaeribacter aquaticus]